MKDYNKLLNTSGRMLFNFLVIVGVLWFRALIIRDTFVWFHIPYLEKFTIQHTFGICLFITVLVIVPIKSKKWRERMLNRQNIDRAFTTEKKKWLNAIESALTRVSIYGFIYGLVLFCAHAIEFFK